MNKSKVFVSSRSFSSNLYLKKKLLSIYPNSSFNTFNRRLTTDEFVNSAKNADKVIVALDNIDNKVLRLLPNLKVISKYGVGLDNINLKDLIDYKIKFGWSRGQNTRGVSELVFGFIFSINRDLFNHQNNLKKLNIFKQTTANEISSKKIGIIGFGSIGKDLAKLLSPLKCKIFYNDIRKITPNNSLHKQKSLNFILSNSDIITIHAPLTKKTKNLINMTNINLCKNKSIIINCARGGIINENALYNFLKKNKSASAAFDVFQNEPPKNNKLLKLKNFYCSAHIGGSTSESIKTMGLSAINGLDKFVDIRNLKKFGYI